MVIENIPLALFGAAIASMLWASLVLLLLASRDPNLVLLQFGLILVTLNGALLFSVSAYMRVTDTMDPLLINGWSRVFYAMFAVYVLGFAWLNWWVPRKLRMADE